MTSANMADGTNITYSYDALGNRRAKTVNGVTTHYLTAPIFGMSHVLAELAPDMSIKATYVYAGPQLLKEEPSATDRSLDLYMLHEGKVGSITHAVDMNGSVRNEYDYDTFGTRSHVKTAGTGSNQNFGYTGEMFDAESGLLYLRARYYDPSIGRFISADPYLGRMAEPVTQNRYIYVHNNPLLFVDPSGFGAVEIGYGVKFPGVDNSNGVEVSGFSLGFKLSWPDIFTGQGEWDVGFVANANILDARNNDLAPNMLGTAGASGSLYLLMSGEDSIASSSAIQASVNTPYGGAGATFTEDTFGGVYLYPPSVGASANISGTISAPLFTYQNNVKSSCD